MKNSELLKLAIAKGLTVKNIDIENAPDLSWHYGNYDVNIDPQYTEVHSQVTSIAWKNLNTGKTEVVSWDVPKGKYGFLKEDKDAKMLRKVIPILKNTDILIGQNHANFDIRKINWRLNELSLPALDNLILIDTLIESRKVFYAPSHKLNFKSCHYGLGGKIKQDMGDCVAVAKGEKGCTEERLEYNGKDTADDDYVFWKELDYYRLPKSLTNMLKLFISSDKPSFCIKCAANRQARFNVRKVSKKNAYRCTCNNCEYEWEIDK